MSQEKQKEEKQKEEENEEENDEWDGKTCQACGERGCEGWCQN